MSRIKKVVKPETLYSGEEQGKGCIRRLKLGEWSVKFNVKYHLVPFIMKIYIVIFQCSLLA